MPGLRLSGKTGSGASPRGRWLLLFLLILFIIINQEVLALTAENLPGRFSDYFFRRFTTDDGISQNMVSSVYQDHYGFIWIGTRDGLNMFDGYRFRVFKHEPGDENSVSDNYITSIYEDANHRLWVGTLDGGLNLFDREAMQFIKFIHDPGNPNSISSNHIQAITCDAYGSLWIGTNGGGINRLVFTKGTAGKGIYDTRVTRYDGPENGFPGDNTRITSLHNGRDNVLWAGTPAGIFRYDPGDPDAPAIPVIFYQYPVSTADNEVVSNSVVRSIFSDSYDHVWIGTDQGIFILDDANQVFTGRGPSGNQLPRVDAISATTFRNRDTEEIWIGSWNRLLVLDPFSGEYSFLPGDIFPGRGLLPGNIISMHPGDNGCLWLGTNGYGLSMYNPGIRKFNYPDDPVDKQEEFVRSSRDLSIRAFHISHTDTGTLWIGANQGFFKVDLATSLMTRVNITDPGSRGTGVVFSVTGDENGFLWIGSEAGLTRFNPADNSYRLFHVNLSGQAGEDEPGVSYVHINKHGIWILTTNTIARLDQETGQFIHSRYNEGPAYRLREAVFPRLHEDPGGDFWIAAKNGLHHYEIESGVLTSHPVFSTPGNRDVIGINAVIPDPSDPGRYLWLGTGGGGLIKYNIESGAITRYSVDQGLANNTVYGILYDGDGSFWMSTNRGLSKFNIMENEFTNYFRADGLQSNEFNYGAFYRSPGGKFFFGGIYGYNSFMPAEIKPAGFNPHIAITSLRILGNNESGSHSLSPVHIKPGSKINISDRDNSFIIEFASLDYSNPLNNRFAFSMTTSGENWISTGNARSVTFSGLKPGRYIFRVRGTNSDGLWSDRDAHITILIAAPWWNRTPMYLVYILAIAAMFYGLRKYELSRIRLRNRARIANFEAAKLKEVDHLKSRFFANISHEFRTPLTLIKGPIEQLYTGEENPQRKKSLKLIISNASRLLQLINQLLDLSRLESDNYHIRARRGDILGFVKGILFSFSSLAQQKSIELKFTVDSDIEHEHLENNFYYDPDILEKIFNNIISNSIKFTRGKGEVVVNVSLSGRSNPGWLEFAISDTGIGIPRENVKFIFDRFYQVDNGSSREYGGAGIGLAYVRELVRVHGAEIDVESTPGKGTTFRLSFPVGKDHLDQNQVVEAVHDPVSERDAAENEMRVDHFADRSAVNGRGTVLIVEDHAGVRNYIGGILGAQYNIIEAANARQGLEMARESIPDLVISDIMMPGMDGFEFCSLIKSGTETSHIPVILLTARSGETDRLKGLDTGADDYLTKPFNASELLTRAGNLIRNRQLLREKFSSNSIIRPNEISVSPRDASFIEKLLRVVETNISDPSFSVADLAKEAGMSHSQLHRKLRSTINMTANHFIRSVRMHRAMELLRKDAGNIAETAFMVGYDDPGYFTKIFRNFFGKLPSEIGSK
jgi:signal transduction histidine kinase/ligand-binding sensor domain-containing protein/DNA-binding response OmpR family regulator